MPILDYKLSLRVLKAQRDRVASRKTPGAL